MSSKKGFLTIRNLPDYKGADFDSMMEEFEKSFELCSVCDGKGYTSEPVELLQDGVQNFKFHKSKILTSLQEKGLLNAERAKQIVEMLLYARKSCKECCGTGFCKKEDQPKDKK